MKKKFDQLKRYLNVAIFHIIYFFVLNKHDETIHINKVCLQTTIMIKSKKLLGLAVFAISFAVKIYGIHRNDGPIWDESHFGKFAYKYLTNKFYFDVHPPLGKFLTALAGYLSNQKGANYDYDEYKKYPEEYDYTLNRTLHAFSGSFLPMFGFLILSEFGNTRKASFLGSMLLVFDNGFTLISKIIVLDPHMLSFMAVIAYLFSRYHFRKETKMLTYLGLAMGCVISIKWIGAVTVIWVGLYIMLEQMHAFVTLENMEFFTQFAIRIANLIVLPGIIYFSLCILHMKICHKSSQDAHSFSRQFNYSLTDTPFKDSYAYISYGNQITMRFHRGYLHSHNSTFPEYLNDLKVGDYDKRFQITVYDHRDENNNFYLQKVGENAHEFVKYGDEIAVLHDKTKGYLVVDGSKAFTLDTKRVIGHKEILSKESIFIIEPVDEEKREGYLHCLDSFMLKNKATGLYITNSKHSFPSWGHSQNEVVAKEKSKNSRLSVEENIYSTKENNYVIKPKQRLLLKNLMEYQAHMYVVNKSLITKKELEPHLIESFPYEWFTLQRGIRMTDWSQYYKFYLLMNPFLLYSTSFYAIYSVLKMIQRTLITLRKAHEKGHQDFQRFLHRKVFAFYFFTGGFVLHYAPMFFVSRVMYLHHYFPAYFFIILGMTHQLQKCKILGKFVCVTIAFYLMFSPLCYGIGNAKYLKYIQLFKTWNFIDTK